MHRCSVSSRLLISKIHKNYMRMGTSMNISEFIAEAAIAMFCSVKTRDGHERDGLLCGGNHIGAG